MTRPHPAQPKSAHTQTLLSTLWPLFLAWSALALAVLPLGLGLAEIDRYVTTPGLKQACEWLSRWFDLIWLLLAAAALHLHVVRREGVRNARRSALLILGGVTALGLVATQTGFPFGPLVFTDKLGWKALGVPLGVPLLWYILLIGSRYSVAMLLPQMAPRRAEAALLAAGLVVLCAINLEPVARATRFYWTTPLTEGATFSAWPPLQAWGVGWFAMAYVLLLLLPPMRPGAVAERWRPLLVLLVFNLVWLLMKFSAF